MRFRPAGSGGTRCKFPRPVSGDTTWAMLRTAVSLSTTTIWMPGRSVASRSAHGVVARGFQPMAAAGMQQLRDRGRFDGPEGRYEPLRTTKRYNGDVRREQHHLPGAAGAVAAGGSI